MRVKQANYIEDYKIKIIFSNGVNKVVDFSQFLKNAKHVFLPLREVDYFREFQVDDITLSWPNGADFDPELVSRIGLQNWSIVWVLQLEANPQKMQHVSLL